MENKKSIGTSIHQQILLSTVSTIDDYAIYILNEDGNIETWNNGANKILGYEADDILGRSHLLFYPKENPAHVIHSQLIQGAEISGKAEYEGYFIRKDGSRFWGTVVINSYNDSEQNQNYFLNFINDLTDKKLVEDKHGNIIEELQIKNAELKRNAEKYHKMISEIRDYAIILLDPDGKILDWNKGAEQLKGYRAEEIIGKNFRLFYTLEDKELNLPDLLLNEAKEKDVATHEGYRIRKNGTRFWAGVTITAIRDNAGHITGFTKVTKDLTPRKIADDKVAMFTYELQQKNEELRQSEERYHKMISEVQDYAILLLNKEGGIQNWNSGAEVIKGYKADEIIGKNFRVFYIPEDIKSGIPDRLLKEAEAEGKATSEGWRVKKDGTRFWANVVITALHSANGEVIGFSKVTRDLTDKKAAEDALKKNAQDLQIKNIALEKLNTELSSFAYVVSHDFKEPIRKIQTFAGRQLEDDKSLEQIKEFSGKIVSSAIRMQNLMESLLSYSVISSQANGLEKVDLNEVLDAAKYDLEVLINSSQVDIEADALPSINGIQYQLHQMFLNLLSNSIKFRRPDVKPKITIESDLVSGEKLPKELQLSNKAYHLITFSDNGIGFDPEQSQKIFEVFQRLHPQELSKGTGIGLSIVRKVVENHHGSIEAEGKPDRGATFRIFLLARDDYNQSH